MSRLTDLIARAKAKDSALGEELDREFKVLASRRAFGLNFERHRPESVELPGRPIRKGDKVRILPPRGTTDKEEQRLWKVLRISKDNGVRRAHIALIDTEEPEITEVAAEDLVVVAEFRDYIYPGLVSTGKVERGDNKPYHTVINGENFHALEALTYTHRGKIDAIYIDPPYNSGAQDWKYNNNYVEKEDLYRHSKWLAMMERRLNVAKELLRKDRSVLIVTIDEKEYLRLGLLLEQVFPEANIQMVSSVINPKGTGRLNEFSRTDEYIFFAFFGDAGVPNNSGDGKAVEVRWRYLRRTDVESARGTKKGGPSQFYPIYVDDETGKIAEIGKPLPHGVERSASPNILGCTKVFPIRENDGMEMNWGLTGPSLKKALENGFVRVSKNPGSELQPYVFSYLTAPNVKKIEQGVLQKNGQREDGSWIVIDPQGKSSRPTTVWQHKSHEAGANGTSLLRALLPGRKFPFPKSLYAVEDCLRYFIKDIPDAVVLDFFSGSGTTAHAVMRLNRQDGGRRQCISVTNNEVAADEQRALRESGLRPGDSEWEKWGICDYITKPRIKAAITGHTADGEPLKGDYKFTDEFPMVEGFEENAEFFTLTYETPVAVSHNLAFQRIAPILWMRAGSEGRRIDKLPKQGWEVADTYGLLVDLDRATEFCKAVETGAGIRIAYIVTDDDRRFQSVVRHLPDVVEPVRLYESYVSNFRFSMGR
ncbi:site-specific DNA-methyltransferase [Billgrantia antri]|uniref:Site-specific DNA-methyltransferase n=1 Tax=Halomonas sulfidivorans TaxID=2733488 RepID=A0ABX7WD57_9GAMM|nr:DNA methyltransferase [Halomonas sulfidivorans]QTP58240.1 site-specific DNA-methyltransferase [Halomonas sulfidivorans]